MTSITLTAERPRRWWRWRRVTTWHRTLPEFWEDIPQARRRLYYAWMLEHHAAGLLPVLIHCLHLPRWAVQAIPQAQIVALTGHLQWMLPKPNCERLVFPTFEHKGVVYHMPNEKGQNITCIEFPLADEYYLQYAEHAEELPLLLLVATLCRESDPDSQRAARREDKRTALHSRTEILARANQLRTLPIEIQLSVLQYFAGLKQYIHNTYGGWLWDKEEEEPDDDEDEQEEPENTTTDESLYPDFGLWGFFQEAAEANLFGTLEQVYQASLHDVFMWGVRQAVKADQQRAAMRRARPNTD